MEGRSGQQPLLVVDDVHTSFSTGDGPLRAVDGVSLTLHRGSTTALVGESGCGKTMLARTIMRLLPPAAVRTGGRVLLSGRDIEALDDESMREVWGTEMAMVFQDPTTSLNPARRCGSQISDSLRYHLRLSRRQAAARAVELLDAVGISEPARRARQYPHELSGGMRQRVMLAIALACDPDVIVADEPTTSLDVTMQKQILDLMQELQGRHQAAMLLITHDLAVVAGRAQHTYVMYAGKVVEHGPTRDLFRAPAHPYTEALLGSIPRLDAGADERLVSLPGQPPDLVRPPSGCRFAPRCRYVSERCHDEQPALTGVNGGHREVACFFPVGGGTGPS